LNPVFASDMFRVLMRSMPFDPEEPDSARNDRMYGALCALSGTFPRDEIEMMYAVGAIVSFHAGAACFRLGVNGAQPNGENTRHISSAGSAMRTFDAMAKGLERRQVRPMECLRAPRDWSRVDAERCLAVLANRLLGHDPDPGAPPITTAPGSEPSSEPAAKPGIPEPAWTPEMVASAKTMMDAEPPPPPAIEGVESDGSIVVPVNPTPEQEIYIAQRMIHNRRDQWADDIMSGAKPKIPPIRPGDRIP
jgi:hypothetical protein